MEPLRLALWPPTPAGAQGGLGYGLASVAALVERVKPIVRSSALPRQLGVAVVYCASVALAGRFSMSHWIVLTGLHLGALLLVDYRYWPALFAGDVAWLGYLSLTSYAQLGALWALVNLIPPIAWYAPLVLMFREHWGLDPARGSTNMPALVVCSVAVSGIATMITIGQLQVTPLPSGSALHYEEIIPRLVLGNLLGVLTVTPVLLVWQQGLAATGWRWRTWLRQCSESRLAIEAAFAAAPFIGALCWAGGRHGEMRDVVQLAMFLPVVVLAMRHGWRGAAVGGLLASAGIMVLMPRHDDAVALQAEAMMAVAIAAMLVIGARITYLDGRVEREQSEMRTALAQTQRQVNEEEAELRAVARALEEFRESFQGVLHQMLGRAGNAEGAEPAKGAALRGGQLAPPRGAVDPLHPSMLAEWGLPGALGEDALARLLHDAGMDYSWDLRGPVKLLRQGTNLALYRIVLETLADACSQRDVAAVRIRIRCGELRRSWAVAVVDIRRDPEGAAKVDWPQLLPRLHLRASGMGRRAIEHQAALFEGAVRERPMPYGRRTIVGLLQSDSLLADEAGDHPTRLRRA